MPRSGAEGTAGTEAPRQEGAWYGWCLVSQQVRPETARSLEGQARGWAFMLSAVKKPPGAFIHTHTHTHTHTHIYIYTHLSVWPGLSQGAQGLCPLWSHVGSSSLTKDGTPCLGSSESQPLDHQGSPHRGFKQKRNTAGRRGEVIQEGEPGG